MGPQHLFIAFQLFILNLFFVVTHEISATEGVADGLIVNWFMIFIAPEK